jgi:hypothetical protein
MENGDAADPMELQHGKAHQPSLATKPRTRTTAGQDRFSRIACSLRRDPGSRMIHSHQPRRPGCPAPTEDGGINSLIRVYHVSVAAPGRNSLRMKSASSFIAISVALLASLAWCSGPCCASPNTGESSLAVGAVPCCGDSTECQPSVQSAKDLASAPHPPTLPAFALLGVRHPTPDAWESTHLVVFVRPRIPRPDLLRLDAPLLI